jgi:CheY-like chemotaxis protein/HPt (histidine-containing phosphotransfer) domain-containing protein
MPKPVDIAEGQVEHDICFVFEITDSMPPSGNKDFLTRFFASTRRRLERAQKVINSPEQADGRALGMDIHLIWGEAAMLDLPRIAQLAREAEAASRRLGVQDTTEARIACAAAIRAMHEGLAVEEARWSEPPTSDHAGKGRLCRVLVVDDNPFAARALSHVFERNGFEVRTATTTSEALELCATFGPTILVTDVHMPGLEVSDLCDRFRAATQGRRTGIVLVSARSDAELQDCLHTTGADDFVPKCAGTSAVVNRVLALSKDIGS